MIETLDNLLEAPEEEKEARGTRYTPKEIVQKPTSWRVTFKKFEQQRNEIRQFLRAAGLGDSKSSTRPVVYLVGA
ncbi:MAG TPA: hypothetical protein VJX16_15850, partial [Terriglobales bacterium]|nr:hypothetical protein [Terriglobales bacterium]